MEGSRMDSPQVLETDFTVVCCQMEIHNADRPEVVERNVARMEDMLEFAVEGYMDQGAPVKLVVFPEFSFHGAAGYSSEEMRQVAIRIPGPEIERLAAKAREYDVYVVTGSAVEDDPETGGVFNTMTLLSPSGEILWNYRKVNVWYPLEAQHSPVDFLKSGYDLDKHPLFPVARTEIGNIGGYTCYDGIFPEVTRQLAYNGADILVRTSAYMDPWGSGPTDWWGSTNRVRSLENMAYGVCCNAGASLRSSPPYSWPGHSMVVDYEGRVLAEVGEGERLCYARINIARLREYRRSTMIHNMLAHARHDAYDYQDARATPIMPEVAESSSMHARDWEDIVAQNAERFYGDLYGEPCSFPRHSGRFWEALERRKG